SSDVSVFRGGSRELSLLSRTASGGTQPISVTVHRNVVYVLNAGGAGNITGFTIEQDGELAAIVGSTQSLSSATAGPAQVSFSADGRQLVVSEKGTSLLDVYPVDDNGAAGGTGSVRRTARRYPRTRGVLDQRWDGVKCRGAASCAPTFIPRPLPHPATTA